MLANRRLFTLSCAMAVGMLALASSADASIQAFSRLNIEDFELRLDGSGEPVTAGTDITVSSFNNSASANATLNGVGVATASASPSVDTLQAKVGGPLIGENDFNQQPTAFAPFSRGDTAGGGAIIAGLEVGGNPIPFGASAITLAETQLADLVSGDGTSGSRVGSNAQFTIESNEDLNIIASFMADLLLYAELDQPPGLAAEATSAFSITVTGVDGTSGFFNFAPTGTGSAVFANGITGMVITDPFSLNQGVSQLDDGITSVDEGPDEFSVALSLPAGTYRFDIAHNSNASANSIIPEPASVLMWAGLAGLAGVIARRRMKK